MSKADEFRRQADEAGKRARETRSLQESATEHKREQALKQLADNEDWLDGKVKAN
jgi:hypothetical protein